MAFSTLALFPSTFPGIELPITRTLIWHSIVQESIGGVQTVQQPWTYPRYAYELSFSFLRQASSFAELQAIMGFYNLQGSRNSVWQYSDPNDGVISTQTIAVGDGVTTGFQMIRTRGGFAEPVFAVSTISTISSSGVAVTSTQYTISNKGILSFSTFTPLSGSSIAWSGTYNWFCRFSADEYPFTQFTGSSDRQGPLWETKLKFETVKFGA